MTPVCVSFERHVSVLVEPYATASKKRGLHLGDLKQILSRNIPRRLRSI